jgi:hypothetical protein
MAKAINWPLLFREEVLAEDSESERLALRLGDLYYHNRYWVPDEEVDIRVNHKKIRKAMITRELRQCPLKDLQVDDLQRLKASLRTLDGLIQFLSQTYNRSVLPSSLVTVVTYRNCPVIPEEVEMDDDPHM